MKTRFEWLKRAYAALVEKQGFPVVVTVCVCVITASALWTRQPEAAAPQPTPTSMQDVSAAHLRQQSLREVTTPSPLPEATPAPFLPPLQEFSLLTAFSSSAMQRSGVTGIWAVHDAADLQAEAGSPVSAMADGTVLSCGQDQLRGAWVLLDHGNSIAALYAGMAEITGLAAGDAVRAGNPVGYVGNGTLCESDLPPHLHLRVTKDGKAVDPLNLWE